MTTIDRTVLEAKIGPKAEYYLRRFEKIDAGRLVGWNWPAFFLSTAWFSYRGMGGWAALNLFAPWMALVLAAFTVPFLAILGAVIIFGYPVVFFILVPLYADALYYRHLKRETARSSAPGSRPSSPTSPVSATVIGLVSIVLPALVLMVGQGAYSDYTPRSQMSEAISLMGGAKTPIAEYYADKGKWPDDLKQVVEHTSGRYTDRIAITSGAGAASGVFTITATMKATDVNGSIAGKTAQMKSEDGGKTWTCRSGAVNGVGDKYLPATCRQ